MQGNEKSTENHREVDEESHEAVQQLMEQNDEDDKLKEMHDEKLIEELMESDEDLMSRMVELLDEDKKPCEDRRHIGENNELEELENLLEKELLDESNRGRDLTGDVIRL